MEGCTSIQVIPVRVLCDAVHLGNLNVLGVHSGAAFRTRGHNPCAAKAAIFLK